MNNILKASTLAEVLVSMVLSGILLISMYEGLGFVSRSLPVDSNAEFYDRLIGHGLIENLKYNADSVRLVDGIYLFYSAGQLHDSVRLANGTLIWNSCGCCDSIFVGYDYGILVWTE
ncbi:MAG: hypothetical protein NC115_01805 [Bacteroidales bacterium]|nr:hypothetical protein [Bacteroidales bacterium]